MKSKTTIVFFLAGLCSAVAYPFKIDYAHVFQALNHLPLVDLNKSIHEDITDTAFRGIFILLEDGTFASFSDDAITGLKEENTENDEKGIDFGFMHFDDSRLAESAEYAWVATNAAIKDFKIDPTKTSSIVLDGLGADTVDGRSVITNIGTAIHTVQDFFAHSTWVETNENLKAYNVNGLDVGGYIREDKNKYAPIPLIGIEQDPFDLTRKSDFSGHALDVRIFNDEKGETGSNTTEAGGCISDGENPTKNYSASAHQISSAYYDFQMSYIPPINPSFDFLGASTSDWNGMYGSYLIAGTRQINYFKKINWPRNFCTHGDNGPGINKDHSGRIGYRKAINAATQATRSLALHFLNSSGATSPKYRDRACNGLLSCLPAGLLSFEHFKIESIPPSDPTNTATNGRPSFKFQIDSKIANQGLLRITFDGEPCHIYDDYLDSPKKNFFCDSDKKGPGKLRVVQKALTSVPLFESDTFIITCEKGVRLANGSCVDLESSGNALMSGETLTATVVGLTDIVSQIEWWLDTTKQVITSRTVGMISDAQKWVVKELGTHKVTAVLKAATDDVLATLESTFSVAPKVMSISQMTPLDAMAGSTYEFALLGQNIPEDGRINFDFPQCSGMLKVNHTDSRVDYSCTPTTPGTYVVVVKDEANEKEIARFSVSVKAPASVLFEDLSELFDGSALNADLWNIRGVTSCGGHQVNASKVTFFGGSYADTKDKKAFSGKKIVVEALMAGTQGNRDTHFELIDVVTGQIIQLGDTNYSATATPGVYLVSYNPQTSRYDFDKHGIEPTTTAFRLYRLTLQGQTAKVELGDGAGNNVKEYTFTLPNSIEGRSYYLRAGTGAPDCYYSPGTFDSIKVSTESAVTNEAFDDFDGDALDLSKWSSVGYGYEPGIASNALTGSYTISNGVIELGYAGGVASLGKQHFKGHKIVVEARVARTGNGEFPIMLVNTNKFDDRIVISDTTYCGAGYVGGGAGIFLNQEKSPQCGGSTLGNGFNLGSPAAVGVWMEYRLTVEGNKFTMERGPTLSDITQSATATMSQAIDPYEFFLYFRTGSAGGYYGAKFDWVRVKTSP
jgi:hypothetical protein